MLKARPLRLRPVRIYRGAKYPKAGEPLDVDLGDPRSWPFSPMVTGLLVAATGLPGCFGITQQDGGSPDRAGSPAGSHRDRDPRSSSPGERFAQEPSGDLRPILPHEPPVAEPPLENPFALEKSKLPSELVWGKGTPGVLPEEIAMSAILEVFAERGLAMKTNVVYHQEGVALDLDGLATGTTREVGFELVSSSISGGGGDFQWPDGYTTDPQTGQSIPFVNVDDPSTLNELEMKTLDQDAAAGSRYIALINPLDPRFVYPTDDFPKEILDNLGVENQDQQAALQSLVAAVHGFIDFVEQQGAL